MPAFHSTFADFCSVWHAASRTLPSMPPLDRALGIGNRFLRGTTSPEKERGCSSSPSRPSSSISAKCAARLVFSSCLHITGWLVCCLQHAAMPEGCFESKLARAISASLCFTSLLLLTSAAFQTHTCLVVVTMMLNHSPSLCSFHQCQQGPACRRFGSRTWNRSRASAAVAASHGPAAIQHVRPQKTATLEASMASACSAPEAAQPHAALLSEHSRPWLDHVWPYREHC